MDSFELNKIAGAVLGTALLVMAISIVSEGIYEPSEAENPGYVIAVAEPEAGAGEPGGGAPEVAPIAARLQTADVAAGESSAKKCLACHTFDKGGPAKVGPNLFGIVGNHAAHMEGFKYSAAMTEENGKGMTWTFDELDHFLTNPKAEVPGTAMAFAGLKKPDERANVIAYLRTLSDSPVPLPEAPAAAPPAEGASAPGAEPAPAGQAPAAPGSAQVPAAQGSAPTPQPANQPPPATGSAPEAPPAGAAPAAPAAPAGAPPAAGSGAAAPAPAPELPPVLPPPAPAQ